MKTSPCPCGHGAGTYHCGYFVSCNGCGKRGPEKTVGGAEEATELWNNMVADEVLRAEFEQWASDMPREWDLARRTYNTTKYVMRHVQCAWEVMQWTNKRIKK